MGASYTVDYNSLAVFVDIQYTGKNPFSLFLLLLLRLVAVDFTPCGEVRAQKRRPGRMVAITPPQTSPENSTKQLGIERMIDCFRLHIGPHMNGDGGNDPKRENSPLLGVLRFQTF